MGGDEENNDVRIASLLAEIRGDYQEVLLPQSPFLVVDYVSKLSYEFCTASCNVLSPIPRFFGSALSRH
jgi:hypothetical protein